uniref:C-type lectin domain-containing protein n=1 Tax=Maylandia zebra TaxID=106582 RepID=A0A3P9DND4_9CICH
LFTVFAGLCAVASKHHYQFVRIFNLTRSLEQNRSCSVLLLMFQQRPNSLEYGLFSGSTRTFVFINIITSWANARSYCRLHYTDLASVRSMTENQKIDNLVPLGIRVWIGLFRESWKWMDGSNSSFTYWKTNEPNGPEPCVAANFEENAKWEDWNCESQKDLASVSLPQGSCGYNCSLSPPVCECESE